MFYSHKYRARLPGPHLSPGLYTGLESQIFWGDNFKDPAFTIYTKDCVGLWIRIRIHFPSWIRIQEKKIRGKNQKKCLEIVNNCIFIRIKKKKISIKNGSRSPTFSVEVFFYKFKVTRSFVKWDLDPDLHLDPDPHWEKQLDPDPQKKNVDPQHWDCVHKRQKKILLYREIHFPPQIIKIVNFKDSKIGMQRVIRSNKKKIIWNEI